MDDGGQPMGHEGKAHARSGMVSAECVTDRCEPAALRVPCSPRRFDRLLNRRRNDNLCCGLAVSHEGQTHSLRDSPHYSFKNMGLSSRCEASSRNCCSSRLPLGSINTLSPGDAWVADLSFHRLIAFACADRRSAMSAT